MGIALITRSYCRLILILIDAGEIRYTVLFFRNFTFIYLIPSISGFHTNQTHIVGSGGQSDGARWDIMLFIYLYYNFPYSRSISQQMFYHSDFRPITAVVYATHITARRIPSYSAFTLIHYHLGVKWDSKLLENKSRSLFYQLKIL